MKKKLEAELMSLAHRILKLKNKSELQQLQEESRKLYEKLSVLLFVEENFSGNQPTIGRQEATAIIENVFENDEKEQVQAEDFVENNNDTNAEKVVEETPEVKAEVAGNPEENDKQSINLEDEEKPEIDEVEKEPVEETTEEISEEEQSEKEKSEEKVVVGKIELSEDDLDEEEPTVFENEENISLEEVEEAVDEEISTLEPEDMGIPKSLVPDSPHFELAFDKKEEVEEVAKESGHQIIFEDFLGEEYKDLEFVKAEIREHEAEETPVDEQKTEEIESFDEEKNQEPEPEKVVEPEKTSTENKPQSDKVTKGITIGLNDRVGFVNNLFGGSNEDFNRVLSQLNTFDNFEDAKNFVEDLVKPDYNDWKGKEDYEERFLEVVENKFK
ncbi:hypothetical protein GV828_01655 [Flavobacterium sp. NST-5]|uniref:MJ0042 family finger-like protein n=1 Tax=Flavobacterium ichthyis TaxID=2698827 RepID=A0ABW9Z5G5_9FLAO|nr:hypothetical protein [Flavobacterium ichthyis]NBL63899.1 hypothetical protein [Flavobacterium ichthyis]